MGQENHLERETATHSSALAWEIPCRKEPGGLQSMEVTKGSDITYQLNNNNPASRKHFLTILYVISSPWSAGKESNREIL